MLKSEARTAIRSTYEDVAGAPTDSELNVWLDLEQKLFRRELTIAAPTLYQKVDATQTIANGAETLALPSDYDSLIRVERLDGVTWLPVDVSDALTTQIGAVAVREEGAAIKIGPTLISGASYRLIYNPVPASLASTNSPDETLAIPVGCEDILIERVAARARVKLEEDPSPHLTRAAAVWNEQKRALRRRYGRMPVPGLRSLRRW
jgi:hypothetical protein